VIIFHPVGLRSLPTSNIEKKDEVGEKRPQHDNKRESHLTHTKDKAAFNF
jgi:hypothetical protein